MEHNFHKLKFAKFKLTIQATQSLWLPTYKGSTFTGAFGTTFKNLVCVNKGSPCESCEHFDQCSYFNLFRVPNPGTLAEFKDSPYVPSPFVLEPPVETKEKFLDGDLLSFYLILIGKAIDFLPQFILTFREIGLHGGIGKMRHQRMGRFLLQEVRTQNKTIYSATTRLVDTNFEAISWNDLIKWNIDTKDGLLKIQFQTSARIKHKGSLLGKITEAELNFQLFIENLYRRIFMLHFFHCNGDDSEYDQPQTKQVYLHSSNLKWRDWKRYSSTQDTKMKLGGIIGDVVYEGNWKPWQTLIKAGEYLHIGKATTFGLGKYEIVDD